MPISAVPDGSILGRDIISGRSDGLPLLRAGTKLSPGYCRRLTESGIHAVYIDDAVSDGIVPEPLVTAETRATATKAVAQTYQNARATMMAGQSLGPEVKDTLTSVLQQMLAEVSSSDGVARVLTDLSGADAYTFQHSIDVTALGLLIGQKVYRENGWTDFQGRRRYDRIEERLFLLGMGLLLHDIGKLAIPVEILQKPGKLTPDEWRLVRTHPRAGIDLLRGGDWSPLVQAVVLRHHERWDGSGYPGGKCGVEIHEMARIAAIADVFDAITSSRIYQAARPPHVGVQIILEGAGEGFDPAVVDVFRRLVAPFPTGSEIELEDGRRGIVASVPPDRLDRPVVRVLDGDRAYEVSLEDEPSLQIAGWTHQAQPAQVA